ncbi:MAG: hypothetical protein Q9159_004696 [Coniocarpon cinnabarinum]
MLNDMTSLFADHPASMLRNLLLAILVGTGVSYVVYQTVLHPLAEYPGPFWAKLTNLYSVYHAVRGTRHSNLYELHRKHGEIVRFGPNHVSLSESKYLEPIYGSKANVQKSSWYSVYYSLSIFNAVDKNVHARKKRVMSHVFSDQAVREIQPYILEVIKEWCRALGDTSGRSESAVTGTWSSPKDMRHWAAYVVFDSLGELLFGKSFETTSKNDNRYFLDLMVVNVSFNNIIGQMPLLKRLNLGQIFMHGQKERRAKQIAFSRSQLEKRLAMGPDSNGRRDIIHYLQQARDPLTGEGYSKTELMGETTLLLGAGSDTANTALTSIWYFLAHHKDVLVRLTASIRQSFASVEQISSGHVLSTNTYLRACIDESLRLCPPIPMHLPREVCEGGLDVYGHHFPRGTIVGVPTYALHHSERYFDRPFEYDPSRWLAKGEGIITSEGNSSEVLARQREAFVPFSIGPRACIGRTVALFELYVCVARVLYSYDIRLAPGTEHLGVGPHGEYKMKDHFIVGKEGPLIQFKACGTQ